MTQRRIYQDEYPYFVTTNTADRQLLFYDTQMATILSTMLFNACLMKDFHLIIHSILPDHLHMIVLPHPARGRGRPRWDGAPPRPSPAAAFIPSSAALVIPSPSKNDISLQPTISDLMHSIKSLFAHAIDRKKIWQRGFYFRIITNEHQFANIFHYIRNNYIKHGLPEKFGKWPYVYIDRSLTGEE